MKNKLITPITTGVLLAIASQSAWAVSDVFRFVGHGPISAAMGVPAPRSMWGPPVC